MKHKESILKLKSEGKSYNEICKILNCSKGTVCYHLGEGQKQKTTERRKSNRKKRHPFMGKIEGFIHGRSRIKQIINIKIKCFTGVKVNNPNRLSIDEVITKIGDNPTCYLTGQPIDINEPSSYHFDHIIPKSRGGDNSLENLGICTKLANMAKSTQTPEELFELCKSILIHNGYKVSK